mmetsp:Transcript_29981/g.52620  ORF Transcript_29981/g.52620 Transcript_29981/m.52620 type:complete len:524 (-) Transcript_29981:186-1757(-)
MFFSQYIVVKKGPLNKVWLAAHMQKKLTKNFVIEIDIADHVKTLLDPSTPLALRLSGQLLLGLVHIYSRKARYLQDDCSSAMANIKVVFRTQAVIDLPENVKGPSAAINMMEGDDELDFDIEAYSMEDIDLLKSNVARDVDITQESRLGRSSRLRSKDGESDSDIEQPRNAPGRSELMDDFDINIGNEAGDQEALLDFDNQDAGDALGGQSSIMDFDAGDLSTMNGTMMQDDLLADPLGAEQELDLDLEAEMGLPPADVTELPAADDSVVQKVRAQKARSRKRARAVLDAEVELSSKQIKQQLRDTSKLRCARVINQNCTNPKRRRQTPVKDPLSFYLDPSLGASLMGEIIKTIKKSIEDSKHAKEAKEQAPQDVQDEKLAEEDPFQDGFEIGDNFNDMSTIGGGLDTSIEPMEQPEMTFDEDVKHGGQQDLDDDSDPEAQEGKKTDRVIKMYRFLKNKMADQKEITFQDLLGKASRKAAAGVFHEILVLKTRGMINVKQDEPYGIIDIEKTKMFNKGITASA